MSRLTPTLIICLGAAALAVALLWLPPRESASPDPAYAPPTQVDAEIDARIDAAPAARAEVSIANFAFTDPGPLAAGQEVVVTNNDSAPHTLTADDGSFDTGLLQAGESVVLVMPAGGGDFSFFCEVHPSMTGTFRVSA